MNAAAEVVRDERTLAVEDRSYRIGYLFLSFALLIDVMYRSFFRQEAPWDLLALVILAGGVSTVYQWSRQILTRHSLTTMLVTVGVAVVVAIVLAALRASA